MTDSSDPLTRIIAKRNATIQRDTYDLLRRGRIVWPAGAPAPYVVRENWTKDFDAVFPIPTLPSSARRAP